MQAMIDVWAELERLVADAEQIEDADEREDALRQAQAFAERLLAAETQQQSVPPPVLPPVQSKPVQAGIDVGDLVREIDARLEMQGVGLRGVDDPTERLLSVPRGLMAEIDAEVQRLLSSRAGARLRRQILLLSDHVVGSAGGQTTAPALGDWQVRLGVFLAHTSTRSTHLSVGVSPAVIAAEERKSMGRRVEEALRKSARASLLRFNTLVMVWVVLGVENKIIRDRQNAAQSAAQPAGVGGSMGEQAIAQMEEILARVYPHREPDPWRGLSTRALRKTPIDQTPPSRARVQRRNAQKVLDKARREVFGDKG